MKCLLRSKEVEVYNQREGLIKIIKEFDPHIIILDYNLNEDTALEVLQDIQRFSKKCIPIIFTGQQLSESDKTNLYHLGAMNIILKPTQISTIESIIENYNPE